MFTTLRQENDTLLVEETINRTPLACNKCRSTKLKCTREKGGCHRCLSRGVECEYPQSNRKSRSKRVESISNTQHDIIVLDRSENAIDVSLSQSLEDIGQDFDFGSPAFFPMSFQTLSEADPSWPPVPIMETSNSISLGQTSEKASGGGLPFSSLPFNDSPSSSSDEARSVSSISSLNWSNMDQNSHTENRTHVGCGILPRLEPDGLRVGAAENPDTAPTDISCCCTSIALSLLEPTVLSCAATITVESVPNNLQLNKRVIADCKQLLNCPRCLGQSNFVTLLIILFQNIVSSYENVIAKLIEQYNSRHPENQYPSPQFGEDAEFGGLQNLDDNENHQLLIRDYEADIQEESCIYGSLLSLHLQALWKIMERLKALLQDEKWTGHILLIGRVKERVRELLRVSGACYIVD